MQSVFFRSIALVCILLLFALNPCKSIAIPSKAQFALNTLALPVLSLKFTTQDFENNNLSRFPIGIKNFIESLRKANAVRLKKRKSKGSLSHTITYEEQKIYDTAKQDLFKVLKLAFVAKFSFGYFVATSVVLPFMSTSPWAWDHFPSTFTFPSEIKRRHEIFEKRRIQMLVDSVSWLNSLSSESGWTSSNSESNLREKGLSILRKVASNSSIEDSLVKLKDLYQINNPISNEPKRMRRLRSQFTALNNVKAWPIYKDFCKCTGDEKSSPNIPFFRSNNRASIGRYIKNLRKDDRTLVAFDIGSLKQEQLEEICRDRFIHVRGKSTSDLVRDVESWLANTMVTSPKSAPVIENDLNKRLVLLGLNLYEDFKTSRYSEPYRDLLR